MFYYRHSFIAILLGIISPTTELESRPAVLDMLPGIVVAGRSIDLTPPHAGLISNVSVAEMQSVQAGDLLVRLDDRLASASLAAALAVSQRTASLRRASLNVKLASKYAQRIREMFDRHAASGHELDEAEGRLEESKLAMSQAEEDQREAQTRVDIERERLRSHQLRAPFAGTVMRVSAETGAVATPNDPLLRLVDLRKLRVALYVPVALYGQLRVGATYELAANSPAPSRIPAVLVAQEPVVDAATNTFRCIFEIENSDLGLPSGFAVRLCRPRLIPQQGEAP